jgi:hypothetical protein
MGSSNAHLRADKFRGESRANDWGKRGHQYPDWMPTRAKPFGTTPGTSVASILSRKYLDYDLKKKILPTLTNASVKRLRFILVRNIGGFRRVRGSCRWLDHCCQGCLDDQHSFRVAL